MREALRIVRDNIILSSIVRVECSVKYCSANVGLCMPCVKHSKLLRRIIVCLVVQVINGLFKFFLVNIGKFLLCERPVNCYKTIKCVGSCT